MTTSDPGRTRTSTQSGITPQSPNSIAIDHAQPPKAMVANHSQQPPASASAFALNNLVASSAAALCSRLCTHPLDTLKTCIQVSNTPQPIHSTLASLVRTGGLYRGLPIALTLSVPGLSVYLTAYDLTKETLAKKFSFLGTDTVLNHLSSAVVAEVSSGLFWTPMEILKSKQQVETMSPSSNFAMKHSLAGGGASSTSTSSTRGMDDATRARTGTFDLARKIYRQEGLTGFYRGYFITLGVFVPYSMIYFATYEQLKEMAWRRMEMARRSQGGLDNDALTPSSSLSSAGDEVLPFTTIMGCAAVACGVAAGISNTVDVVKTRWQTSILVTSKKNSGSGHVDSLSSARRIARHMFQQGGLASFTQGMGARVLWMIPSVTISMSVFEWIKAHGLVS
ncbi:hypothetical protein EMPS_01281 [Entomortierella parvispora]|uniref:Mitochondrial carrier protein n=1 Tax=Entomortierella parvispora TaxID=205924 RepID=A0A9P3LST4_9FUNG|nr:hypothetical protein EMPS_01281 [Entomortierella parvispora]